MYFSRFGKIQYGFDKDNFKIVTDVMKRVKVKDKVLNTCNNQLAEIFKDKSEK